MQSFRAGLVEVLRLDLIGPDNEHSFARELLPESPTRWYLARFLVPTDAPIAQRFDETSNDEIDSPAESGDGDDTEASDRPAARRSLLPSSMGLSVLVREGTAVLWASVQWSDYAYEAPTGEMEPAETTLAVGKEAAAASTVAGTGAAGANGKGAGAVAEAAEAPRTAKGYRRIPRTECMTLKLPSPGSKPVNVLASKMRPQTPKPGMTAAFSYSVGAPKGMMDCPRDCPQ